MAASTAARLLSLDDGYSPPRTVEQVRKLVEQEQVLMIFSSLAEFYNVYAYATAQTLVQVLKQCGDQLARENAMRQAANLKNLELPILLPGTRIDTAPNDYSPGEQMQLQRFGGKQWVLFGEMVHP